MRSFGALGGGGGWVQISEAKACCWIFVWVLHGSCDVSAEVTRFCFKTNWPPSLPKTWFFAVGVNKNFPFLLSLMEGFVSS